jgi:hypothetical protein
MGRPGLKVAGGVETRDGPAQWHRAVMAGSPLYSRRTLPQKQPPDGMLGWCGRVVKGVEDMVSLRYDLRLGRSCAGRSSSCGKGGAIAERLESM